MIGNLTVKSTENNCSSIGISSDNSYIYINNTGPVNSISQYDIIRRSISVGKNHNIRKYLIDTRGIVFSSRFIVDCDFFYNTLMDLFSFNVIEKIAVLVNSNSDSNYLIHRLASYYLDNFSTFVSKRDAVEYLVNDKVNSTSIAAEYPYSAISKKSIIVLKNRSEKLKCTLCNNTFFRYNSSFINHPFQCLKCGTEHSIHDLSVNSSKIVLVIVK